MWRTIGKKVTWKMQKQRRGLSRLLASDQLFREAKADDKAEVLCLRNNALQGLDYLPDYYDFFINDKNRSCIVGEIDSKIVSFVVTLPIDGGQTMCSQAGRVHEHYEGNGLFRLLQYINKRGRDMGYRQKVALVEPLLNKYVTSEKFCKTHVEIATKLVRIVKVDTIISLLKNADRTTSTLFCDIKKTDTCELEYYFATEKIRHFLFPQGRLIVDYIPYRAMPENICRLAGRNSRFFSNIQPSESGVTGLLSAGTWYTCKSPPASYIVDIFGNDVDSLERHFIIHLLRALKITSGEFCLQLFVEKEVAETLCEILVKFDVPQNNKYIEGGVSINSIVEELFN